MGSRIPDLSEASIEKLDTLAKESPKDHELQLSSRHIGTLLEDFMELHEFLHTKNRNTDFEPPETENFQGREDWGMVAHPPSLKHVIAMSPWSTRGWTLQERLLSRRCLYFFQDYVYFQCNRETLVETGGSLLTWADVELHGGNAKEVEKAKVTNPLLHFREPSVMHKHHCEDPEGMQQSQLFDGYTELIEMYSRTRLSFQSDILNAVAGMLRVMRNHIGGDLIAGIPTQFLDLVMMWTPAGPLDMMADIGQDENEFPTWSWTSWTGRKQFRLASEDSGHGNRLREFAASEVDCFSILHGGELVEIHKALDGRVANNNAAQNLEPKIEEYVPYTVTRTQDVLGSGFGPNVLQFWTYTVPIEYFCPTGSDSTLLSEPEHGNQRGEQYVTSLRDSRGKHCGLIFNVQAHSARRRSVSVDSMEYILISSFSDSTRRRFGIATIDPFTKPFDPHAFPWMGEGSGLVNVMLIEWFQNVAKRYTVAQINRQAWENARPVRKWITLG